jgi:peptidoglycan-associated lipoprotein
MTRSIALLLGAAVMISACSRGDDASGLFNGGSSSLDGPTGAGSGLDGGPIDQQSLAFFSDVIGDRVLFPVDQSSLTPEAMAILDKQAAWLSQRSAAQITIEGHADEQGTREYNIALSARRASAVRDYLVTKGIPDARLSTVPYGKERPIEVCSTEVCWSKNRRAVTVVTSGLGA